MRSLGYVKKVFLVCLSLLFHGVLLLGQAIPEISHENGELYFESNRKTFGTVNKQRKSEIIMDFDFTNTGHTPIVIIKTDVSCSCISAEYSAKPIMPGEKGKIIVKINTENQKGDFNKTVIVKSNAKNELTILRIVGHIK